ncbi:nucleotide disphospho-sugar-binding domain-containing protein [Pyxidicoccus sp. 3LFB2]
MARFLLATIPLTGHFNPGAPIARRLVERGHEVRWYTGSLFRSKVEATGARYVPMRTARDFHDSTIGDVFPERAALKDFAKLKFDLTRFFIDSAPGQLADLEAELRDFPADVVVCDTGFVGASLLHERHGLPWAAFGITAMTVASADTAPFGLGLRPGSSPLMRLRNRALAWGVSNVLFRDVNAHLNRTRRGLGLPATRTPIFDVPVSPFLYLQGSVPSFEYPRSDLPSQVHFIGPFLPEAPADWTPPAWWDALRDSPRPIVHVTQGTLATEEPQLIQATLRALADEDVWVVAATGGQPLEWLGSGPLPANARVERFIPYAHLMPRVSVMVTNGGFGGVQCALAQGVPLVCAGTTEEKPEIANRIAWSGVGVNLKTKTPTPEQVRRAVRTVLDTPTFRRSAQRLQTEIATHDAPAQAAVLLERLAATRAPVLATRPGG